MFPHREDTGPCFKQVVEQCIAQLCNHLIIETCTFTFAYYKIAENGHTMQWRAVRIRKQGNTLALWVQCLEMATNIFSYIRAQRTRNIDLHFKSTRNMLPYFIAVGHHQYAKHKRMSLSLSLSLSLLESAVSRLDGWSFQKGSSYGKILI